MTEFRKAPDGQPTANIELMLQTAKLEYTEWEKSHARAVESAQRAERMMNYWDDEENKLEWQLEQRRKSEVNGL